MPQPTDDGPPVFDGPPTVQDMPPAIPATIDGPTILYASTEPRTVHKIDADGWDPACMSLRERALCRVLLEHCLTKLNVLDKAEQMGLVVGRQEAGRG